MADTELEDESFEHGTTLVSLLVSKLEKISEPKPKRESIVNVFAAAFFLFSGIGFFLAAYLSLAKPEGKTAFDDIMGAIEVCGGFGCWGVAWLGSIIDDKL